MGAHTDYECLTLLHTRNEGLQVMTPDDHWIDVPVDRSGLCRQHRRHAGGVEQWTAEIDTAPRAEPQPRAVFDALFCGSQSRYRNPTLCRNWCRPGSAPRYEPFLAGDHLERMLLRDFPYLRARQQPDGSPIGPADAPLQQSVRASNNERFRLTYATAGLDPSPLPLPVSR